MTKAQTPSSSAHTGRRQWGHAQDEQRIDPYKRSKKLEEPTVCPQCGAVYQAGRWHWTKRPAGAHETLCQACLRINDKYPAGVVTITGTLTPQLKAELQHLARHQEEAEKPEHPMNWIMSIVENPNELVISTTDIHLPRRIGEAIDRAHRGTLKMHFDEHAYSVRVTWQPKA